MGIHVVLSGSTGHQDLQASGNCTDHEHTSPWPLVTRGATESTHHCSLPHQETLFSYYVFNNIKPMLVSFSEYFDTFTDDVKVLQCRKAKFRQNSEGKKVTGYSSSPPSNCSVTAVERWKSGQLISKVSPLSHCRTVHRKDLKTETIFSSTLALVRRSHCYLSCLW